MPPLCTSSERMQTLYRREIYSVEGHRVVNDAHQGWKCECTLFAPDLQCDHVRQALRFRAIRQAAPP